MQGLLKDCREVEELAARIYRRLAAEGGYHDRVRATFRRLAADEDDHARQLELALSLPAERLDAVTRIAWNRVGQALEGARSLEEKVRAGRCSEQAALSLAIELENRFARLHLDNAVHFHDRTAAALFEGLARSDEEHLDTLRECLAWWQRERRPAPRPPGRAPTSA